MAALRGPLLALIQVFQDHAGDDGTLSKEEFKILIEGKQLKT